MASHFTPYRLIGAGKNVITDHAGKLWVVDADAGTVAPVASTTQWIVPKGGDKTSPGAYEMERPY